MRRPPSSTTASPQLASCRIGEFLAASSTGTNRQAEETGLCPLFQRRFFRWRSSVLKVKPRLWQNSLRACHCSQTQPPTAELPLVYGAWALKTLFLRSSGHFTQTPPVEQVCWSDAYDQRPI